MKILFVAVLLNCFAILGQNPSYKLFNDEIFQTAEKDYQKAKTIYEIYQKKYSYDPLNILNFLEYSLINDDIKFFKKEIINLTKKFGYYYIYQDVSVSNEGIFALEIYEHNLQDWMLQTTNKYYPKWLKNHPRALELQKELSYSYVCIINIFT